MMWTIYGRKTCLISACVLLCAYLDITTGCSEYLVSGLDGVSDDKITASSSYRGSLGPQQSRLYTVGSSWCSKSNTHLNTTGFQKDYLQVEFDYLSTVVSIMTQGRQNYNQWVASFYVQYSDDGQTWTVVKNNRNKNKLFTGNVDRNTLKENTLPSQINAKYIRIIPDTWYGYRCMRFGVIGCPILPPIERAFYGEFVPIKIDKRITNHTVFEHGNITLMPECVVKCSNHANCTSFSHNRITHQCHGYRTQAYGNDLLLTNGTYQPFEELNDHYYYFDRALPDMYRYTVDSANGLCYKFYTDRKLQQTAEATCNDERAYLLPFRTNVQLTAIQAVIASNIILSTEAGFLVDGKYNGQKWVFHNGYEIPGVFWAAGKNTTVLGECVMVTSSGLSAAKCNEAKFFICGV